MSKRTRLVREQRTTEDVQNRLGEAVYTAIYQRGDVFYPVIACLEKGDRATITIESPLPSLQEAMRTCQGEIASIPGDVELQDVNGETTIHRLDIESLKKGLPGVLKSLRALEDPVIQELQERAAEAAEPLSYLEDADYTPPTPLSMVLMGYGITQKKLSELTGVPIPTLSQCNQGKRRLTAVESAKIAKALRIPVEKFQEDCTNWWLQHGGNNAE